jgi:hypothetical protein
MKERDSELPGGGIMDYRGLLNPYGGLLSTQVPASSFGGVKTVCLTDHTGVQVRLCCTRHFGIQQQDSGSLSANHAYLGEPNVLSLQYLFMGNQSAWSELLPTPSCPAKGGSDGIVQWKHELKLSSLSPG